MSKLLDKFRGTLVGALAGDCLGAFFEGLSMHPIRMNDIQDLLSEKEKATYTDDSAMTRAICRSLMHEQGFNIRHLAQEFCNEYFSDRGRGYGEGVVEVFRKLKTNEYDDVRIPAKEQFGGTGSYGNGGAMRISPIALFSKERKSLLEFARQSTEITHTHANGVNGAILQAQAVFDALKIQPPNIDKNKYIDGLAELAQHLEDQTRKQGDCPADAIFPYESKIKEMKSLLSLPKENFTTENVVSVFGNGIRAEQAVPAAIFAFLYQGTESVEGGVNFAISLGGDTDTIASMTGAISGAYLGLESISQQCRDKCEGTQEAIEFADKIYELNQKLEN